MHAGAKQASKSLSEPIKSERGTEQLDYFVASLLAINTPLPRRLS